MLYQQKETFKADSFNPNSATAPPTGINYSKAEVAIALDPERKSNTESFTNIKKIIIRILLLRLYFILIISPK